MNIQVLDKFFLNKNIVLARSRHKEEGGLILFLNLAACEDFNLGVIL